MLNYSSGPLQCVLWWMGKYFRHTIWPRSVRVIWSCYHFQPLNEISLLKCSFGRTLVDINKPVCSVKVYIIVPYLSSFQANLLWALVSSSSRYALLHRQRIYTCTKNMKTLFSWCVLLVLLTSSITQRISYNCTSEDVKHSLRFLIFFPCPYRDLNECDMLTMSAVEIAMDRINQNPHILSCFKLEL